VPEKVTVPRSESVASKLHRRSGNRSTS